jgi:hypothetical protein
MLAKLDADTRLFLELDFLDDGEVEFSQRIPRSDWDRRTFRITPPTWYEGVRFIIRKDGPGYAALAQLSAESTFDCTAVPIELLNRPAGSVCEDDGDCASGDCDDEVCAGCSANEDCDEGQLCGLLAGHARVWRECVDEASTAFAGRCAEDAQCASGICCHGVCSACCTEVCANDQFCDASTAWPIEDNHRPWLCAPGVMLGESGDPCVEDADCASAACEGGERACAECFGIEPQWCPPEPCENPYVIGGACR